jgi:hypothetical protein
MIGDEDEGKRDKKVNERENKNVGTYSMQQLKRTAIPYLGCERVTGTGTRKFVIVLFHG